MEDTKQTGQIRQASIDGRTLDLSRAGSGFGFSGITGKPLHQVDLGDYLKDQLAQMERRLELKGSLKVFTVMRDTAQVNMDSIKLELDSLK